MEQGAVGSLSFPIGPKTAKLPSIEFLMKRLPLSLLVLLTGAFLPFAAGAQTVASTSWTAAIARAAGATDVVVIAPLELKHPPEYEIKPSDLAAVQGAKLVLYGGYEKFASRLVETSGTEKTLALKLATDNVPAALEREAKKVAEVLGTLPAYEKWAEGFNRFAAGSKARVLAAYPDKRAVVQRQLKTYAEGQGFEVVGVFGPGELSPAVVLDLVKLKPALVIDNAHNPSGPVIAEALKVPYVQLINFPGMGGTKSLEDVFRYNEQLLVSAGGR